MTSEDGPPPWPPHDPLTVEPAPLLVLPVEPEPRPPHPGFWMAVVWCVAFFLVVNVSVMVFLVPILVPQALQSRDREAFLDSLVNQEPSGEVTVSPTLARAMAPAILGAQVTSILFGWLVVRWLVGRDWRRQLAFRPPSVPHFGLLLLGMPAFLILPDLIAELARGVLPSSDYQQELDQLFRHWPVLYGVLAIGLGAGIGEELWCRGFLGRGLVGRYGVWAGVLLTSLLFGLMHLDPPHVVATACMGVALHFVYLTTRSLVAPMFVHAFNNSAGFLLTALAQDNPAVEGFLTALDAHGLAGKVPLYAASALLLAAVGWALYQNRVRVVAAGDGGPAAAPLYPGVADPSSESGAILRRRPLGVADLAWVVAAFVLVVAALSWTGKPVKKEGVASAAAPARAF